MILRAENLNLSHGVKIAKNIPTYSHMLYAYDIVLFLKKKYFGSNKFLANFGLLLSLV